MSLRLRRAMQVLAVIGIAVATYLTIVHYAGLKPACTAGTSCIKVQTSVWAEVDGVPVALLGLIGYVLIFASLLAPDREETRVATLGLALVGFGFSMYLTYREAFSIHSYCEWCLSSAAILTILMILSAVRFVITDDGDRYATLPSDEPEPDSGPAPEPRPAVSAAAADARRPRQVTRGNRRSRA